jgi:hypothetical protein
MAQAFPETRLLSRKEAAVFLTSLGYQTAHSTLAKLACIGGGPVFKLFSRKPLYSEKDLLAWVDARCTALKRSTSDTAGGGHV